MASASAAPSVPTASLALVLALGAFFLGDGGDLPGFLSAFDFLLTRVEEGGWAGLRCFGTQGAATFAFDSRAEAVRPPLRAAAAVALVWEAAVLFFRGGVFF